MSPPKKNGADKVTLEKFYEELINQNQARTDMEQRLKDHLDAKLDGFTDGHLKRLDGRIDNLQKESRVAEAVGAVGVLLFGVLGLTYPGKGG